VLVAVIDSSIDAAHPTFRALSLPASTQ